MNRNEIHDMLEAMDENVLLIEGHDDALVGFARRCGEPMVAVYDRVLIIEELMRQGASFEDADEYVAFNIEGAWLGPGTPVVMERS